MVMLFKNIAVKNGTLPITNLETKQIKNNIALQIRFVPQNFRSQVLSYINVFKLVLKLKKKVMERLLLTVRDNQKFNDHINTIKTQVKKVSPL